MAISREMEDPWTDSALTRIQLQSNRVFSDKISQVPSELQLPMPDLAGPLHKPLTEPKPIPSSIGMMEVIFH